MSILDQIKSDLLQARKDQSTIKSTLLTTLLGEIELMLKSGKPTDDADIYLLIGKFLKNNGLFQTALCERGDTNNSLPILIVEAGILNAYMPKIEYLTDEQVKFAAEQLIAMGFKAVGQLIGQMKKTYGDKFNPPVHKAIIEGLLNANPK